MFGRLQKFLQFLLSEAHKLPPTLPPPPCALILINSATSALAPPFAPIGRLENLLTNPRRERVYAPPSSLCAVE